MAKKPSGMKLPGAVASLIRSPVNPVGTPQTGSGAPQIAAPKPRPPASMPAVRSGFSMQGPPLPGVGLGPALTRIPGLKK